MYLMFFSCYIFVYVKRIETSGVVTRGAGGQLPPQRAFFDRAPKRKGAPKEERKEKERGKEKRGEKKKERGEEKEGRKKRRKKKKRKACAQS